MSNNAHHDGQQLGPASPELAGVEVHGMTRSSFILRGALAAGAVYGASAVTPFVSQALAATRRRRR